MLGPLLALAVAFNNSDAMREALVVVLKDGGDREWQYVTVAGLLDALNRRAAAKKGAIKLDGKITKKIEALTEAARQTVRDTEASDSQRKAAIRLMARKGASRGADIKALGALLKLQTSANVQVAIVSHLGKLPGKEVPNVLLSGWKDHTPSIRSEVLNVLTARPDWMGLLLDAVEKGPVAKIDVDAGTRQLFMINRGHRPRAMKLFSGASNADRLKVVKSYEPALKLKGDVARGKLVFQKVCIACHKVGDIGLEIGPNLASVTDRRPESMLSAILDPNAAVEGKYSSYIANTKDGRAILGILISETGANITIKDQVNQEHVILRSELVSLANTGRSLMPDGLEVGFDQQELADLIAFVVAAK